VFFAAYYTTSSVSNQKTATCQQTLAEKNTRRMMLIFLRWNTLPKPPIGGIGRIKNRAKRKKKTGFYFNPVFFLFVGMHGIRNMIPNLSLAPASYRPIVHFAFVKRKRQLSTARFIFE